MSIMRPKRLRADSKKIPWKLSLGGFLFLALLCLAIYPVRIIRSTVTHRNDFAVHSSAGDQQAMQEDMENINYDYERLKSWKLRWLADKYIFSGHIYRDARLLDLAGRYKAVIDRMEGIEDRRAYFFKMLAHFHRQRELYYSGKQSLALDAVLKETSRMAEQALEAAKSNPNPIDAYNYDLLTNPGMAGKALEGKGPPVKYELGPEPGKKLPGNDDKLRDGNLGGSGKPKRKG